MADIEIIGEDPLQIVVTEDSPIAITVTSGLLVHLWDILSNYNINVYYKLRA